jgi:threonine dehydrogenase-like Zn-dependent dehydrogenase
MIYCGVCGSDIGIFSGEHPRAKAPLILGHEFVGVIEEVAGNMKNFKPGDRVVAYPLLSCGACLPCGTGSPHICRSLKLLGIDVDGGIAEYASVDTDVLFKVPDELSDKVAATIEPLAVIVRSLRQARFQPLDSTVVIGAGPIGMLTGILLKHCNASRIIISDTDEARLALCREFGFETVDVKKTNLVDYVSAVTGGNGVDIVFECSGTGSGALEVTRLARIGGCICITGVHKAPRAVNLLDINFKEQWMVGSRVYTKREFELTVYNAASMAADLEKIVSQVVPLSESDKIFAMIADPTVNTVKVLVDCRI